MYLELELWRKIAAPVNESISKMEVNLIKIGILLEIIAFCWEIYLVYNHILGTWDTIAIKCVSTCLGILVFGKNCHVQGINVTNPDQPISRALHCGKSDSMYYLHIKVILYQSQIYLNFSYRHEAENAIW
jgi:hypothetical protein